MIDHLSELPVLLSKAMKTADVLKKRPGPEFVCQEVTRNSPQSGQLFLGDNLPVLSALLRQPKLDLIYCDPPFDSAADYVTLLPIHSKTASPISRLDYQDNWKSGSTDYLAMLIPRLILMRECLADSGLFCIHLDWHASHYVKILLDAIFGKAQFINEIIWSYRTGGVPAKAFARKHDVIYIYAKTTGYYFNPLTEPTYIPTLKNRTFAKEKLGAVVDADGCPTCGQPGQWMKQSAMRDVWEIPALFRNSRERVNYRTQKPEALLARILSAGCPPEGRVGDFFCGSGTTPAVAARLGRSWIGVDQSEAAIRTTRKRLINSQQGFSLWKQRSKSALRHPVCRPVIQLVRRAGTFAVTLTDIVWDSSLTQSFSEKEAAALTALLRTDPLALVDSWAIDPDYDGQVFQTAWVSTRPDIIRHGTAPLTLSATLPACQSSTRIGVMLQSLFGHIHIEIL